MSFTKGCYVGQETVARLFYKGKPKRHLRGLRASAPLALGRAAALGERVRRHARRAPRVSPRARPDRASRSCAARPSPERPTVGSTHAALELPSSARAAARAAAPAACAFSGDPRRLTRR